METRRVVLLFEGFDEEDAESTLRDFYTKVMVPFVMSLLPAWEKGTQEALGNAHPAVTEAFDGFIDCVDRTCTVISASGSLAARTRFGYYDAAKDAAMLGLAPDAALLDYLPNSITLRDLFGLDYNEGYSFLVFSLVDMRIGTVVHCKDAPSGAPDLLPAEYREGIFGAAGIQHPL